MESRKKDIFDYGLVVVIAIVIALLIGYFYKKREREKALEKRDELKKKIEEKKELKIKLEKRFKLWYFIVRLLLVIIWLGFAFVYHYFFQINSVEDFLIYSEISLVILITINFLRFGSISNINNYVEGIKAKVENGVFRKHLNLENEIENDEKEERKVVETIKEMDVGIKELEDINLNKQKTR